MFGMALFCGEKVDSPSKSRRQVILTKLEASSGMLQRDGYATAIPWEALYVATLSGDVILLTSL